MPTISASVPLPSGTSTNLPYSFLYRRNVFFCLAASSFAFFSDVARYQPSLLKTTSHSVVRCFGRRICNSFASHISSPRLVDLFFTFTPKLISDEQP